MTTYAERIEAIARALCVDYGNDWDETPEEPTGMHSGDPLLPARSDWRGMARAADAACLKALEEPTREMYLAPNHKVPIERLITADDAGTEVEFFVTGYEAQDIWHAMWPKIDRGET